MVGMRGAIRGAGLTSMTKICDECGQRVIFGQDETHSNRCPVWGSHSYERCEECRLLYRPPRGWEGDVCPDCVSAE